MSTTRPEPSYHDAEYVDSIEDIILQAIQDGNLNEVLDNLCRDKINEKAIEALRNLIVMILEAKSPKLFCSCLCVALGMNSLIDGLSGEHIAKLYGCTRQNVNEIVKGIRAKLGLENKTRTAKAETAKESYRKSNITRQKEENE